MRWMVDHHNQHHIGLGYYYYHHHHSHHHQHHSHFYHHHHHHPLLPSTGASREFVLCANEDAGKYVKEDMTVAGQYQVKHGDLFVLGEVMMIVMMLVMVMMMMCWY